MNGPDYRVFLRALSGEPCPRPTLFEPFIPKTLAEQLIWRRGAQLWDTPEHYAQTMLSLRERTQADVVVLDIRSCTMEALFRLLDTLEREMPAEVRAVLLSDKTELQREAESSPAVCAVGGYGETHPMNKPFIRMDKTPEDALSERAAGYFAKENGIALWERLHGRLAVCGGLGAAVCGAASPVGLYRMTAELFYATKGAHCLPGTGGEIAADAYLQLISLLGGIIRLR